MQTLLQLEELKVTTGITDFSSVTPEQFGHIIKKAAENTLSLGNLKLLVQTMPHFVQLQSQVIEGLKKTADGAQPKQRSA